MGEITDNLIRLNLLSFYYLSKWFLTDITTGLMFSNLARHPVYQMLPRKMARLKTEEISGKIIAALVLNCGEINRKLIEEMLA